MHTQRHAYIAVLAAGTWLLSVPGPNPVEGEEFEAEPRLESTTHKVPVLSEVKVVAIVSSSVLEKADSTTLTSASTRLNAPSTKMLPRMVDSCSVSTACELPENERVRDAPVHVTASPTGGYKVTGMCQRATCCPSSASLNG